MPSKGKSEGMDRNDAVLELDPISSLPEEARYAALRLVDFQVFRKGEIVYAQGRTDNSVQYLLDGDPASNTLSWR